LTSRDPPTRGKRDRDRSRQLIGAYGQTARTLIGVFALLVTVGAALVGL
jgi:hypothetical protein